MGVGSALVLIVQYLAEHEGRHYREQRQRQDLVGDKARRV